MSVVGVFGAAFGNHGRLRDSLVLVNTMGIREDMVRLGDRTTDHGWMDLIEAGYVDKGGRGRYEATKEVVDHGRGRDT